MVAISGKGVAPTVNVWKRGYVPERCWKDQVAGPSENINWG